MSFTKRIRDARRQTFPRQLLSKIIERHAGLEVVLLIVCVAACIMVSALSVVYICQVLPKLGLGQLLAYSLHIIVLALGFGFLIVTFFSGSV